MSVYEGGGKVVISYRVIAIKLSLSNYKPPTYNLLFTTFLLQLLLFCI
jgi:hypothetical protein